MARIRTIKPEFVESESVGKLSREARLLFILLWTFVDDSGRARASSRLLASRLYPYDDDAQKKISGWLLELQAGGHVRLYEIDGDSYLDIPKWLKHQKIDRPTPSRLPEFREVSPKAREDSRGIDAHTLDLVPRTEDHGPGTLDQPPEAAPAQNVVVLAPGIPEAVEIYNAHAEQSGWAKVQRLTDSRRAALKARLAECGGVDGWQAAMAKAGASKFLTGQLPRGSGHANWRPDFDWFVKAGNFTKLMEGSYDDKPGGNTSDRDGIAADFAYAAHQLRDKQYTGL